MGEYGGVVRSSTSAGGSRGGAGSWDPAGDVTDFIRDTFEQLAAQPPEILLVLFAVLVIGGLFVFRRA